MKNLPIQAYLQHFHPSDLNGEAAGVIVFQTCNCYERPHLVFIKKKFG